MKAGKYTYFVPIVLSIYLLVSGYKIINPLPLTYDPMLHSEIAKYVIPANFIPKTWEPLADIAYTYPPLFHWISYMFSFSGIETYKIVVLLGLLLYAMFPVSFYFYGRAFGKKEAVIFSFFGAVQTSLTEVFAAGEYPQLLSMNLLVIVLYFLTKKNYKIAAVFSGFVVLSHTFTTLYTAVLIAVYYFLSNQKTNTRIKSKDVFIFLMIVFLVSLLWIPKYMQIADNAVNHRWENAIWYYKAGFIGLEKINGIFFSLISGARIGLIMLFLSAAGIACTYRRRPYQVWIFLFTVVFTIFQIPGAQYKFPDMLAVAVPPLAAFGAIEIMKKIKNTQNAAKILLSGFLASLLIMNPYANAVNLRNCCVSNDIPSNEQIKLAEWIKNNDSAPSVLMADGDYEAWFALIAGKYPMNPRVSELEVFTDRYREMLSDRQKLIDEIGKGNYPADLLEKWGVNYIVTRYELKPAGFQLLRGENGTKLYKRYA